MKVLCVVLVAMASLFLAHGHPASSEGAPAARVRVAVVQSFNLTLQAVPGIIVPASDGAIWITADHEQAFMRVDGQTGATTSFGYPNGGANVLKAVAGPNGSLWWTDGLNGDAVFRVERDGQYRRFPIFERLHAWPNGVAAAGDGSVLIALSQTQKLLRLDSTGGITTQRIPDRFRLIGLISADAGSLWLSTAKGPVWRSADGLYHSFTGYPNSMVARTSVWNAKRNMYVEESEVQPQLYRPCVDGGIAYQVFPRESYAHPNDYFIGWISTRGPVRDARRWPKEPAPSPSPRSIGVVSCHHCGGGGISAQRPNVEFLGCTSTTAWVRVGDSLERLTSDAHAEVFPFVTSQTAFDSDGATDPTVIKVWLYDPKAHKLFEVALR